MAQVRCQARHLLSVALALVVESYLYLASVGSVWSWSFLFVVNVCVLSKLKCYAADLQPLKNIFTSTGVVEVSVNLITPSDAIATVNGVPPPEPS